MNGLNYPGIDFSDGESVILAVTQVTQDFYLVSDRGQVADRLAMADVDLSTRSAFGSWSAVKRGLDPVLFDASPFEMAHTAESAAVGRVITDIASRMLQADGLQALGKARRPKTAVDRAIAVADRVGLTVVPRASITNKYGGKRRVHFKAESPRGFGELYVMAVGRSGQPFNEAHDAAKAAFDSSEAPFEQRLTVINPRAAVERWHRASLREVSVVVDEDQQEREYSKLVA